MASLLQSCKSLREGRLAHHHHILSSLLFCSSPSPAAETHAVFLQNLLIKMYGNHGSAQDAFSVFSSMHSRDSFSWTFMMSASFCQGRHGSSGHRINDRRRNMKSSTHQNLDEELEEERAFFLFGQMKCEGFLPDSTSIATFFRGCSHTSGDGRIDKAKQTHASLIISFHADLESDLFICNSLINLYAKNEDLDLSRSVFDRIVYKDSVSWTTIASGYAKRKQHKEALFLLHRMKEESLLWDQFSFTTMLSSCIEIENSSSDCNLVTGKYIHTMVPSCSGYEEDVAVGNALLRMYMKCGREEDVEKMFQSMDFKNEISYTTMINAYMMYRDTKSCLQLFHFMQNSGFRINKITYVSIISSLFGKEVIEKAEQLHVYVVNETLELDVVLETALITMYGRCWKFEKSRKVFDRMVESNVCTWNAMIVACAYLEGDNVYTNHLLAQMMQEGFFPDRVTYVTMISMVRINSILDGKRIHASIISNPSECDISLENALLSMYGKCGLFGQVLEILSNMLHWDKVTLINVLSACTQPKNVMMGRFIHGCLVDYGCIRDSIGLVNALMSMYSRCGCLHETCRVFENAPKHDNVSWSILMSSNNEYGYEMEALCHFGEMQKQGFVADKVVLLNSLSACARLGREIGGKCIHTLIMINIELEDDIEIRNALIDMYSKCGALLEARKMFEMTLKKDVVLWTSIISAYAQHGQTNHALRLFIQMKLEGTMTNSETLVNLLSGWIYEEIRGDYLALCVHIIESGFESDIIMGTALVSLFGRAGDLGNAVKAFNSISAQTSVSCNAMITVFGQHGQGHSALQLMGIMRIQGLMLDSVTLVGLLSACSHDGLINEASYLIKHMRVWEETMANLDHYNCIFDLLRRTGRLDVLNQLLVNIPFQPSFVSWMTFLARGCEYWDDMLQGTLISHAVELNN